MNAGTAYFDGALLVIGSTITPTTAGATVTVYVNQYYEKNLTSGEVTVSYYLGAKLIAVKQGGDLSYVHQNSLGSTSVTSDSSGNLESRIAYFPFGSTRSSSGSLPTDKQFTGQRLDTTGLYFYNARYYDPEIGRFISADTIVPDFRNPQALNRYSYCLNNPLKYTDPTGHGGDDDDDDDVGLDGNDDGDGGSWWDYVKKWWNNMNDPNHNIIRFDYRTNQWIYVPEGYKIAYNEDGSLCVVPTINIDTVLNASRGATLGENVTIDTHVLKYLTSGSSSRGWTAEMITETINNPWATSGTFNRAGQDCTVFWKNGLDHVVVNNTTREVIGVSNIKKADFRIDWRILQQSRVVGRTGLVWSQRPITPAPGSPKPNSLGIRGFFRWIR